MTRQDAHRFYISSPYLGLQKEREQAKQLITRRYHAYRDSYGGSPEPVVETCQGDVRGSDHYILILGERYGSRRPEHGGKSVTELEFEAAIGSGRSLHAFFLNFVTDSRNGIERDPEAIQALEAFRERVRKHCIPLDCQDMPDGRTGWEVFVEGITSLAASPPARPGDTPAPTNGRTYTPADLDAWVERHHERLEQAFMAIPSVHQRRVHVPLDVRLTPAGAEGPTEPMLLQPEHLEPLLADGASQVLLISGDGGTGKTSLAFRIARWLMEGQPGSVRRLPLLIETALAEHETVADRAAAWLKSQLPDAAGDHDPARVEALLRSKRLIPILDHVSELPLEARQRLVENLPPGLVIATSRSSDDGYRERPLNRLEPRRIPDIESLLRFFLDYQQQKRQQGDLQADQLLMEEELIPSLQQLKRIVGDKPITALLAQMFIDDVIAKRKKGVLAGSVPELMLSYVERVDTPSDERMRQRAGVTIDGAMAQRALKVLALASHRLEEEGRPVFKPMEFRRTLALEALAAGEGMGMKQGQQREGLLAYLIELNLLKTPDKDRTWLRLPLDPLADYLAAMRQLELLEDGAAIVPEGWETFLRDLEARALQEHQRMRGFLLALRDCCLEQAGKDDRVLAMPADAPDRLGRLGFLDPEEERFRLALQRARKWMWELGVPVASERRDAIAKLAAMAAASAEPGERRAVRTVASQRLAVALRDGELPIEERGDAAVVLGLIGTEVAVQALERAACDPAQHSELRRAALEALGLAAKALRGEEAARQRSRIEAFLEERLRADALDLLVAGEEGWAEHDRRLPPLQGASRALQMAASVDLPLLGAGPGRKVPMLTLTALKEGEGLRIRTEVVEPAVWKLPLPDGEQLELVAVPGGEYEIGSPVEEEGRDWYPDLIDGCDGKKVEALRRVRLERFAMVRHSITQAQWLAVAQLPQVDCDLDLMTISYRPDDLWETHAQPGALPRDGVSWDDCQEWLSRLNLWLQSQWSHWTRDLPHRDTISGPPRLALPGEGQWEAACRAGSSKPFHFGDVLDTRWANFDDSGTYGPSRKGICRQRPVAVGFFGLVNRWGLAEMHGQLYDWCGDQWHPDPMGEGWPRDGQPWEGEDPKLVALGSAQRYWKLLRGGCWYWWPQYSRAAERHCDHPSYVNTNFYSFRPCCLLPLGLVLGPTATRKPGG